MIWNRQLLLLVFLSLFAGIVSAQEGKKLYERNGKQFYGHVIHKGNTLYSISRQYGVSIDSIRHQNPQLATELSIGDTLWIAAENVEKKRKSGEQSSSNYLTYKVQPQNTLYSIAREYDVEVKDIVLANPELQNGLKVGMELRIPLAKLKKEENHAAKEIPYSLMDKYETHLVQPKETVYSLSKRYNVEIDSILLMNDGLVEGLKVGQEIILPILKDKGNKGVYGLPEVEFDSSQIKKKYKIALLLPFYLDKIQEPSDSTDYAFLENEEQMYKHTKYGVEIYEGFMLAVDTMRKRGLSAEVYVFDAANDTAQVRRIIAKPIMKEMDLIVGPLFFNDFMIAADFAKKHQIDIVSPVKQSNKILLGNQYVSKVISSDPILIGSLAEFVMDSLQNDNVVVVYSDNVKERIYLEQFNAAYEAAKSKRTTFSPKPTIFKWNGSESFTSLKYKLVPDSTSLKQNYIVVLSDNQAMVTQLLTSLYGVYHQYRINVIGSEDWEDYSNLDVNYLQNLNVHLVLPGFVDESNVKVQEFKNKFYDTYSNLPGSFAYLGYDVGYYYLSLLNRYGSNIRYMFSEHKMPMLSRSFDFSKTGIESGYENQSFNLVKYEDYQIKKVK